MKKVPNLLQYDNVLAIVIEFDTQRVLNPSKGSLFGVIAESAGSDCQRAWTAERDGCGTTDRSFADGRWPPGAKNAECGWIIQPGKPAQNAYIESFNTRLRDECLNANWFTSLSDARRKTETWRQDYDERHPHSSLNYAPPAEFARKAAEVPAYRALQRLYTWIPGRAAPPESESRDVRQMIGRSDRLEHVAH